MFSSAAVVDWASGRREIRVRRGEAAPARPGAERPAPALPPGGGRQTVSSDTGSADASPGQGTA